MGFNDCAKSVATVLAAVLIFGVVVPLMNDGANSGATGNKSGVGGKSGVTKPVTTTTKPKTTTTKPVTTTTKPVTTTTKPVTTTTKPVTTTMPVTTTTKPVTTTTKPVTTTTKPVTTTTKPVTKPTVHTLTLEVSFAAPSATLSAMAKGQLTALAKKLVAGASVTIYGYSTNSVGLSSRRASAVEQYLKSKTKVELKVKLIFTVTSKNASFVQVEQS